MKKKHRALGVLLISALILGGVSSAVPAQNLPQTERGAEVSAEWESETEVERESESEPGTRAETESEPESETRAEEEAEPESKATAEARTESKSKTEAESEPESKTEAELPEAETEIEPLESAEIRAAAETGPEAESGAAVPMPLALTAESGQELSLHKITNYTADNFPQEFTYNGTFSLLTRDSLSEVGSGMGSSTASVAHDGNSCIYYRLPTTRSSAVSTSACLKFDQVFTYTNSSGETNAYDVRIYFWAPDRNEGTAHEGTVGFYTNTTHQAFFVGDYNFVTDSSLSINSESYVNMEFHFYKHGETTETSVSGCLYFEDLDYGEGYRALQGVHDVYAFSDTVLINSPTTASQSRYEVTKDHYVVGTTSTSGSDVTSHLYMSFSSGSSSPLQVSYVCHKQASRLEGHSYTIAYHLVGTVPSGTAAPSTKTLSVFTTTNSSSVKPLLFPTLSAAGYLFKGWYTNSGLSGSVYGGTASTQANVDLYASFEELYGNLEVIKTLSGTDASSAVKNNTFEFTLEGTSTTGKTVRETGSITGEGSCIFRDIPVGTFTLTESCSSEDWTPDAVSRRVTVTADAGTGEPQTTQVSVNNVLNTYTVAVNKTVSDPSGTVTSAEGFTFLLSGTSDTGIAVRRTAVTGADGTAVFADVPPGTYTVEETGTPDSPSALPSWWSVQTSPSSVTVSGDTSLSVTNLYETGNIMIVKELEIPSSSEYSADAEPSYNASGEGFAFHLTGTSDSGVTVDQYTVTGADGTAAFENIPVGDGYLVAEVPASEVRAAASAGNSSAASAAARATQELTQYEIPEPASVSVSYDAAAHVPLTAEVRMENRLKRWRVTVTKRDEDSPDAGETPYRASLEGAVYGLYDGEVQIAVCTTDASGQFTTDYYPCGENWYIQEIEPSPGYQLDSRRYAVDASAQNFTELYNDAHLFPVEGEEEWTDSVFEEPVLGSVRLEKRDASGDALAGVTFDLMDEEGTVLAAGTTDETGSVLFADLRPGKYRIAETKTVEGMSLLAEEISAEIPIVLTKSSAESREDVDLSKGIYYESAESYYFYDLTYAVTNTAVLTMPMAGGSGSGRSVWAGIGILAVAGGILLMVIDFRRKVWYDKKE